MIRAALLALAIAAAGPAAAQDFHREDLRIPMTSAEPAGLEAMLVRPSGSGRFPLALISHGAPRDAKPRGPTCRPMGPTGRRSNSPGAVLPRWS